MTRCLSQNVNLEQKRCLGWRFVLFSERRRVCPEACSIRPQEFALYCCKKRWRQGSLMRYFPAVNLDFWSCNAEQSDLVRPA